MKGRRAGLGTSTGSSHGQSDGIRRIQAVVEAIDRYVGRREVEGRNTSIEAQCPGQSPEEATRPSRGDLEDIQGKVTCDRRPQQIRRDGRGYNDVAELRSSWRIHRIGRAVEGQGGRPVYVREVNHIYAGDTEDAGRAEGHRIRAQSALAQCDDGQGNEAKQ